VAFIAIILVKKENLSMKHTIIFPWRAMRLFASIICMFAALFSIITPVNAAAQTVITGPAGSGEFGYEVVVLPNGNIVITDPYYDSGAIEDLGAVYLYNGATLALISRLTGSVANDSVGYNNGGNAIKILENGNFLVISTQWANGLAIKAGAVTWCSAVTGCNGEVSSANSLVGSHENDSNYGFTIHILANNHYVIDTAGWTNGTAAEAGAVTFCNQSIGCVGEISAANSLVGTQVGDHVGWPSLHPLSNGNYVVISSSWTNGAAVRAGAVTLCDGTTGCTGTVSSTNSLVGNQGYDYIGGGGVSELSNGDYLVDSPNWANGLVAKAGAVTLCDGATGCTGLVTATNSLVGSAANDMVGYGITRELSDGNYLVTSYHWANGSATEAGAVTWCNGTTGCIGAVSSANSLVGSQTNDQVGNSVGCLPNGGYIIGSRNWANGTLSKAGAVTFCNHAGGCTGAVSSANSLVGSHADDTVGSSGLTILDNGDFVVSSTTWDNGTIVDAGAVTWCHGTTGCTGEITTTNSLVGSSTNDGLGTVMKLANDNYIVRSVKWDNGSIADAGIVTWCDGETGCVGEISAANSLVGNTADDRIGYPSIRLLTSGAYVVTSQSWDNGVIADVGAVTWCDGEIGCTGVISSTNSLVGSVAGDQVGSGSVEEIINGDYLAFSPYWANGSATGAGAITRCNGTTGCVGEVTNINSLVGSQVDDNVGLRDMVSIDTGAYVVKSQNWDNGIIPDAGAVTWCDGDSGCTGEITSRNSVLGETASGGNDISYVYDNTYHHLIIGRPADNKVSIYFLSFVYLPLEVK
jgi:hypothetical protein